MTELAASQVQVIGEPRLPLAVLVAWSLGIDVPPGSATGRCLYDHRFGQWLESQFDTRLAQARERVQGGHDTLWPLRIEGWRPPGWSACSPPVGSSFAPGTRRKARQIFTLKKMNLCLIGRPRRPIFAFSIRAFYLIIRIIR